MSHLDITRIGGRAIHSPSLFAMLLVVGATVLLMLGRFNPAPSGDKGAVTQLFHIAVVLFVPAGMAFLVTVAWPHSGMVVKRLFGPAIAFVVALSKLCQMGSLR